MLPPGSLREIARMTGLSRDAVRTNCYDLCKAGWVEVQKGDGACLVTATAPPEIQRIWAKEAQTLVEQAGFKQEAVMRALLDGLVADPAYTDNFRAEFLKDPETQQPMEFDRFYYRARRAFEYNGEQHYHPTRMFPDQEAFRKQQTRDLVKDSLARRNGVRLTIVEAKDLSIDGMLRKAEGMPLARLPRNCLYSRALEQMCKTYAGRAREKAESAGPEVGQATPGVAPQPAR